MIRRSLQKTFPLIAPNPLHTLLVVLGHHHHHHVAAITTSPPPPSVAIFWDLDNKPPPNLSPYSAAVRLTHFATRFGPLAFSVAYANPHSFRYVPSSVLRHRQALDHLEPPHPCPICGRRFSYRAKLLDHFKNLHEREQSKRLRQLESAKGARRSNLAGKFGAKIEKYRKAAREIAFPPRGGGYGLLEELRRAGVWVRKVGDGPQAADRALREHMVDTMDGGGIGCLVLVSDDLGFVDVVREARDRCLRVVVVGDDKGGGLKRCADAGVSWREVASGKARDGARTTVAKWRDREILSRLEWTYQPEDDENRELEEEEDDDDCAGDKSLSSSLDKKTDSRKWWELEADGAILKTSR